MARIRTVKPEFAHSESMARVSRDARLLFVLMWTIADDAGRLRGTPRYVASMAFPYDEDAPDLAEGWLAELEQEGCILRYLVEGKRYIAIVNWSRHQRIEKPSESRLPGPEDSPEASPAIPGSVGEASGNPPGGVGEASDPRARALDLGTGTREKEQPDGSIQKPNENPRADARRPTAPPSRRTPKVKPEPPASTRTPDPLWDAFCAAWRLPAGGGRHKGLVGEFARDAAAAGATVAEFREWVGSCRREGTWGEFVKAHTTTRDFLAWRDKRTAQAKAREWSITAEPVETTDDLAF